MSTCHRTYSPSGTSTVRRMMSDKTESFILQYYVLELIKSIYISLFRDSFFWWLSYWLSETLCTSHCFDNTDCIVHCIFLSLEMLQHLPCLLFPQLFESVLSSWNETCNDSLISSEKVKMFRSTARENDSWNPYGDPCWKRKREYGEYRNIYTNKLAKFHQAWNTDVYPY